MTQIHVPTESELQALLDQYRQDAHPALASMTITELRQLVEEVEAELADVRA